MTRTIVPKSSLYFSVNVSGKETLQGINTSCKIMLLLSWFATTSSPHFYALFFFIGPFSSLTFSLIASSPAASIARSSERPPWAPVTQWQQHKQVRIDFAECHQQTYSSTCYFILPPALLLFGSKGLIPV